MTPDELATRAQSALDTLRPCFSGTIPLRFGGVWAALEKSGGFYTLHLTDVDTPIDAARLAAYAQAFGVRTVERIQVGNTAMLTWEADDD